MTDLRTAAQQALEALEKYRHMMFAEAGCRYGDGDAAITALRAALEQPEQATVTIQEAWEAAGGNPGIKATKEELITALQLLDKVCDEAALEQPEQELPRREWQGLTEEEIHDCFQQRHRDKAVERRLITRAIEAALKERNA